MTTPAPSTFARHIRVTALGTLGTGADRFSYGFNLNAVAGTSELDPGVCATIAGYIKVMHVANLTQIAPAAVLREVKFATVGPDGQYVAEAVVISTGAGAGNGSDPSGFILPQSALAVSLTTARPGASGRGRFYLPMPTLSAAPSIGFQTNATDTANVLTNVQTMLQAVNDTPGFEAAHGTAAQVVVASTKGFNTPVTGVRIGRVIDTIRSRRNALSENYTTTVPVNP